MLLRATAAFCVLSVAPLWAVDTAHKAKHHKNPQIHKVKTAKAKKMKAPGYKTKKSQQKVTKHKATKVPKTKRSRTVL